jgi:NAD(P)-dependent dehydrogenase (short-subunit alcohol dehydrogenase family)
MELEGVAALVSGGASGLGAASARELHAAGAKVAVVDVDRAAGEAVAAEVSGVFVAADLRDEAALAAALSAASAIHGPARVLVNCAGIGAPGARTAGARGPYSIELFRAVVEVNLVGAFNLARLAAQAMTELEPLAGGERGVVINTASVNAMDGPIGSVAYSASKAGIVGLTLPMARDLARFGIRVCTIAPGNFDTPMLRQAPAEFLEQLQATVPFPSDRFGDPAEFGRLARHICENQMLNGETIRLDGAVRMAQH